MEIEELLTIYRKDGSEINMATLGLYGLKLLVPSPNWLYETVVIDGMAGEKVIEARLGPRNLTGSFYTQSKQYADSLTDRDRIYAYLVNGKEWYIGEKNVTGRRWKVRPGEFSPERADALTQLLSIPLVADSGCSETIQIVPKTFRTANPSFNNRGTVAIEMESQDETEIIFKGASTNLQIVNKTTGDVWKYNGNTLPTDVIMLKGVRSTKNGVSIFGQTNRQMLKFDPGWNELEITGTTGEFSLSINTRFYFL